MMVGGQPVTSWAGLIWSAPMFDRPFVGTSGSVADPVRDKFSLLVVAQQPARCAVRSDIVRMRVPSPSSTRTQRLRAGRHSARGGLGKEMPVEQTRLYRTDNGDLAYARAADSTHCTGL